MLQFLPAVVCTKEIVVKHTTCLEVQNNHYGPPRTMLLVGKINLTSFSMY